MSLTVTIVDADHRPDLYAEIEYDGERIAEAFAEGGRMRIAFVGLDGSPMWDAAGDELEHALALAREQLKKFGLLE